MSDQRYTSSHSHLSLNPHQKKAVETIDGKVLILAGAGSGKTSVLAHRIAYMIQEKDIPASAILGLTFTNKAAEEMRQRVDQILGKAFKTSLTLCTFHSFCMQVLRSEITHLGYTSSFSLYDEKDVKRLATALARHLLEHEGELPSLDSTLAKIAHAKTRGHFSDESSSEKSTWHDQFSKELFERLQVCMRSYNAVDFDSLLSLTVELFERFPAVLARYQERYRYIMIDEYQDTNPIQYRLAELLALKYNHLCVVGDDDQSIYGWRGAEIKNILTFQSSVVIKLEQNYRSTPNILKAANAVISHNLERHDKELWSAKKEETPITLFHAPTEAEEAQAIAERLIDLHKNQQIPWKEMAVLYRSNILSRTVELALMQAVWKRKEDWIRGIPYQIFGGTEFYERSEIKDLNAYLRAIANPLDEEALLRIINVPRRGISDEVLDKLTRFNRKKQIPLWHLLKALNAGSTNAMELRDSLSDRARKGIGIFVSILEDAQHTFQAGPLNTALEKLIERIDYKKTILEEAKSDKIRDFKWDNVLHYIESLAHYEKEQSLESSGKETSLSSFLTNTLLNQESLYHKGKKGHEDAVNLMTFHSAKGLEFTACFLIGLEDHIIPHEKSLFDRGVEEERRLFYVAMTRAKRILSLSMARSRKRMGKDTPSNPSRFLFEIPKELVQIGSWKTIH